MGAGAGWWDADQGPSSPAGSPSGLKPSVGSPHQLKRQLFETKTLLPWRDAADDLASAEKSVTQETDMGGLLKA